MTREDMMHVVARLLTDPRYQAEFFGTSSADHAVHGLTRQEFLLLSGLDRQKLAICSEGYTGKRFEMIQTVFPRTLAILGSNLPGFHQDYLDATPFPTDDAKEITQFVAFVEQQSARLLLHLMRFAADVLAVEQALLRFHRKSSPMGYRFNVQRTCPKTTQVAQRIELQGPLTAELLRSNQVRPEEYAPFTQTALVMRAGADIVIKPLDEWQEDLLDRCDGRHSVKALQEQFQEDIIPSLKEWFRLGVVEDGAFTGDT